MMKAKEKKKIAAENKAEEKDIGVVELTVEPDELDLSVSQLGGVGAITEKKLEELGFDQEEFDSLVLLSGDKVYKKSSAALRIARKLSGLYPLLYVFIIIPPFIRHGVYNIIAKNRYKWWGKRDSCRMPTPELKARFVEA